MKAEKKKSKKISADLHFGKILVFFLTCVLGLNYSLYTIFFYFVVVLILHLCIKLFFCPNFLLYEKENIIYKE